MITRIAQRDIQTTRDNLRPGTLIETSEGFQLWQGRDILTEARGGTWQLKTNCWVVRHEDGDRQTYWHGDKTQERNEKAAREYLQDMARAARERREEQPN